MSVATSVVALIMLCLLPSCHKQDNADNDPDLIARIGQQRLTRQELDKAIAPNLNAADSAKLARSYVKSWIDSHLMTEVAARNIPDMSQIDRMVQEYRNELMAWEYRRLMFTHNDDVNYSPDSISAYYECHKDRFILDRPIVKGVFIKIADNSPSLARVKKLYRSRRDADIDRLEKQDLQGIIHYDYFRDRWVDWEQIETRIPYDFGSSPNAFLAGNDHLETKANGTTYLLEISDYIPSGKTMPLERAEEQIRRDIFNRHRHDYDTRLRMELLNQGLSDGTIVIRTPLE